MTQTWEKGGTRTETCASTSYHTTNPHMD